MDAEAEWSSDITPAELADRFRAFRSALEAELEEAGEDIVVRLVADGVRNAPGDEGRLQDSIAGVVEVIASSIIAVRFGSNLEYAPPHEYGLDAGEVFPPSDELRGWAHRVLGDADAAYPVARGIHEEGLEEQAMFRDAIEDNIDYITERVTDAVTAAFDAADLT